MVRRTYGRRSYNGNRPRPRSNPNADFGDRPGDEGRRNWRRYHPIVATQAAPIEPPKERIYAPEEQPFTIFTFDRPVEKVTRDGLASVGKKPMYYSRTHKIYLVFKGHVERLFVECMLEKRYKHVDVNHVIGVKNLPFKLQNRKPYAPPPTSH